jgi:chorismate mutase
VRKVAEGNPGPLSDAALEHIFEIIMREMRALQETYLKREGAPK